MRASLYHLAKGYSHTIAIRLLCFVSVAVLIFPRSSLAAKSLVVTHPGKGNVIVSINSASVRVINWKNVCQGLGVYRKTGTTLTTIRDENSSDLLSTWSSFTFDVSNSNVGDEYYVEAFGARYSTNTNPNLLKKITDANFAKVIEECLSGLIPLGGDVFKMSVDMYKEYKIADALYAAQDDPAKIVQVLIEFGKKVAKDPNLLLTIALRNGWGDFTLERAKTLAAGINLAFVGLQFLDWFLLSEPFDVTIIKCASDYAVEITSPSAGNYQYGLPVKVSPTEDHDLAFTVKNIGSMPLQNVWVIMKILTPRGDSVEITKTESSMLGINLVALDLKNNTFQQGLDIPSQLFFTYQASPKYRFSTSMMNNHVYRGGSYQYKIEVWRNGKPNQTSSQLVTSQTFPLFMTDYIPSSAPTDVRVAMGGAQQKPIVSIAWQEPVKDMRGQEEWDVMEYKVYRSEPNTNYQDIGHVFVAGPTGVLTKVIFDPSNRTTILSDSKANLSLDYSNIPIQPNINHFIDNYYILSNTQTSLTVQGDVTQLATAGAVYAIHSYLAESGIDRHRTVIFQDTTASINKTYMYKVAARNFSYAESDESAEVKIVLQPPTVAIFPDKLAYTLGIDAQATISIHVSDAVANPLSGAIVGASVQDPNGSTLNFSTTDQTIYDNGNGDYSLNFPLQGKPLGNYNINLTGWKYGFIDFAKSGSFRLQNQTVGHNLKLELSVDPTSLSTRPGYTINGSFKVSNLGVYSENFTLTIKLLDNSGKLMTQEKTFSYTNTTPSNSVSSNFQILPSGVYQNYQGEARIEGRVDAPLDEDWANNYISVPIIFGDRPLYKYYKGHPYRLDPGVAITEGNYSVRLNAVGGGGEPIKLTIKRLSDGAVMEDNQNTFQMHYIYRFDGDQLVLYYDYYQNPIAETVIATKSTQNEITLVPDRLVAVEGTEGYFKDSISTPPYVQGAKFLPDGGDGDIVSSWPTKVINSPDHRWSSIAVTPPIGSASRTYKVWLGSNFFYQTPPLYGAYISYAEIMVLPAPTAGVQITCPISTKTINPGQSVSFDLSVKNTGELQDTINLATTSMPNGWSLVLSTNKLFLNPGTVQQVTLSFSYRRGVDIATPISTTISAISRTDPTKKSQIQLTVSLKDTIPPVVKLMSPIGAVSWIYGSQNLIRWEASDNDSIISISLLLSSNRSRVFSDTIASGLPNTGEYLWTIPNRPSNSCKIEIIARDRTGNEGTATSDSDFVITSVFGYDETYHETVPKQFTLFCNYPNPFNPSTTIEFSLPHVSFISLKIYNILGQEVAQLVNETLQPGTYRRQWNANGFASGLYLYRLTADQFVTTKKLLLLK